MSFNSIWGFVSLKDRNFDPDIALLRLFTMIMVGCVVVVLFGVSIGWCSRSVGVGLMSVWVGLMGAFAAMVVGGLIGFIFGVPITSSRCENSSGKTPGPKIEPATEPPPAPYRANTSLEQISDWLSKMFVGVGLVELKKIGNKLYDFSHFIAKGLGQADQSEPFVFAALIYFGICAFLFGFIWGRIYLIKWFLDADNVQRLRQSLDTPAGPKL